MASISGRGYAGIGTSGNENTRTVISRPDIAGSAFGKYHAKNNGIKIRITRAKKKTKSIPKI